MRLCQVSILPIILTGEARTKAGKAYHVGLQSVLVLHDGLHEKLYKYQECHKLEEYDYEKRAKFAKWFLLRLENAKYILICSDDADFYLTLSLNKQNNRVLSDSRPLEGIKEPLHMLQNYF